MQIKELREIEMEGIVGGAITSSFINAVTKAVSAIYNLGKETGSTIRRLTSGKYCRAN